MKNSDTVFGVAATSKKGVDTYLPSVWQDGPANENGFREVNDGGTNWLSITFNERHSIIVLVMILRISEQQT